MTDPAGAADRTHVTIHLIQQTTVDFDAPDLWPPHGAFAGFGQDLASFAEEVTRRLREDGYIGFRIGVDGISIVPLAAVKRIDFTTRT
jgi:hypothetical protein